MIALLNICKDILLFWYKPSQPARPLGAHVGPMRAKWVQSGYQVGMGLKWANYKGPTWAECGLAGHGVEVGLPMWVPHGLNVG